MITHHAPPTRDRLLFFLGGQDLEMRTIRDLLQQHAPGQVVDSDLRWGARTSDYRQELAAAMNAGKRPVLIELEDDLGLDAERVIVIDHHGQAAGGDRATALEQVFALLDLPAKDWTRWHRLVAANDRAYLTGMIAEGATREEMHAIRAADREAQGVTATEEEVAVSAMRSLEKRCRGKVLVARLPHARTAPLVDRLAPELGGPGFDILVVLSPTEMNVFAPGWLIQALADRFPAGWYGGNLPSHGYFGLKESGDAVLQSVERLVEEMR